MHINIQGHLSERTISLEIMLCNLKTFNVHILKHIQNKDQNDKNHSHKRRHDIRKSYYHFMLSNAYQLNIQKTYQ